MVCPFGFKLLGLPILWGCDLGVWGFGVLVFWYFSLKCVICVLCFGFVRGLLGVCAVHARLGCWGGLWFLGFLVYVFLSCFRFDFWFWVGHLLLDLFWACLLMLSGVGRCRLSLLWDGC